MYTGPQRAKAGEGNYKAPRCALQTGAITRREWIRFMAKVTEGEACFCTPGYPHRHWIWQQTPAAAAADRYGTFRWRGRDHPAHRFAYIALREPIAPELDSDHKCRIHACVNPDCIDPCTVKENILRGEGIAAMNAKKTMCLRGHVYTELTIYYDRKGGKQCKTCLQEKSKAQHPGIDNKDKTVCKWGHPFDMKNTYCRRTGGRQCRQCKYKRERARLAKQRRGAAA